MGTEKQVREIKVVVDTKGAPGLKEMAEGFAKVNKNIKETTDAVTKFKNVFLAIQGLQFGGIGLRELANTADSMQKLGDRLKLSEGSIDGAKRALDGLKNVAGATMTSIEDVATVYSRLNLSLRQTGITTDALLGFTTALQQSFRLSGATAAEATAATIQLSQGLASGQLRGQELRSVLEQNALAGDILAKQFNTTRGALLKFSEANGGLDAAGVLAAFANEAENLNAAAEKLKPTIGEALAQSFNQLKINVMEANEALGATEKIIKVIQFLFNNMGTIATVSAGFYLWAKRVTIATAVAAKWTAAIGVLTAVLFKAGTALAILLSPLYIVPTAIAAVTAAAVALAFNFDTVTKKGREFLEWIGLLQKQKSDVDKMKEGWYAATSAQNNYVTSARVGGKVLEESLNPALGDFQKQLILTSSNLAATPGPMERYALSLKEFAALQAKNAKLAFNYDVALKDLNAQFLKDRDVAKYNRELRGIEIKELDRKFAEGKLTLAEYNKKLNEINFGKTRASLKEFQADIGELNRLYEQGKITLGDYADAMDAAAVNRFERDLKSGKMTVIDFQNSMNAQAIKDYRRALYEGNISMEEFISGNKTLAIKQLNLEFQTGKKDIYEYNKQLIELTNQFLPGSALSVGIANYIQSAGTLSQNTANVITQTFGNLEDYMTDFLSTGKFAFEEFANEVIKDINRIIVRALIVRPIAEGILSGLGGGGSSSPQGTSAYNYSGGGSSAYAAKGAAFDGGASNFFAAGGVVSGRTAFKYSGGNGVMGEKGPEAILPLTRDSGGRLGVASGGGGGGDVYVNIVNNSDSEIQQSERTDANGDKIIDVLIIKKMKEAFASGTMDKTMAQSYNLKRKGQ